MEDEVVWYYSVDGESVGPVSLDVLRGLAASGELGERDHVFRDGWDDWVQAQDVAEIWAAGDEVAPVSAEPVGDELVVQARPADAGDLDYEAPQASEMGLGQGLAIASVVLGVLSVLTCGGCLFGIVAIVLGVFALRNLEDTDANSNWRRSAWVGIILSVVSILMMFLFIFLGAASEFM